MQGNYLREKEMLEVISNYNKLKMICPKFISYGTLFQRELNATPEWKNWEYPYLCESFIKGNSLSSIMHKMNPNDMMNLGNQK